MQKIILLFITTVLFSITAQAQDKWGFLNSFQPGIAGSFYNPETSGQGINIEYLEKQSDGKDMLLMYVYTYSEVDGSPTWLICVGNIDKKMSGSEEVNKNAALLDCHYPDSGEFIIGEETSSVYSWGEAVVTATSCSGLDITFHSNAFGSRPPMVSPMPPEPPAREVGILQDEYEYKARRLTPIQRSCVNQCDGSPKVGPRSPFCKLDIVN